ncbi:TIGR03087 family PEP-CTERM/XrtA system glycosyltransferase [Halorhodospira neutriphila]|uniref:Sugar transferase n=1 Tax=Halorhodospira neutriphila TaxID=168379 RepID=A0ABS1E5E8_9GAMM|nr:TIGR03087 family PEP-CTERM/XrtA system glycosyltransferase [Halorhodospira neutriphila]MBK1726963.1 sugar transferase [Halorhodospira neutriphila]
MAEILYLAHRLPWPPNKGDKIRSYHILRHLAERHAVHLGTFVDDPADWAHLPALREQCASVCARPLPRRRAGLRALSGLLRGEALTLGWYRDPGLRRWVRRTLERRPVEAALAFSSSMGQYLPGRRRGLRRVVDFVDVDSDKWRQFAAQRGGPMRAVYRREARRLLAYERRLAAGSDASLFVSPQEAGLFRRLAPESAGRIAAMGNGVDTAYFDPERAGASPYPPGERPVVLTGAMDYWPNVDAACWFAEAVLPRIRRRDPRVRFYVVGNRPAPAVRKLAEQEGVAVTGFVEDVRPWIAHADVAVAPLRIARGVQNKVLEALALARPVVATPQALEGLSARPGEDLLHAPAEGEAFAAAVARLLAAPAPELGAAGRRRVLADYSWARSLARLDAALEPEAAPVVPGVAVEGSHGG